MNRTFPRLSVPILLMAVAAPAWAQESSPPSPETLLAEESVVYLRFDGLGSHEDAYKQTALAQLLRNEFGPLIDDLTRRILDALGPKLLSERLLDGVEPHQLLKVQNANKQMPRLLKYLEQSGFVLGVELISPLPPRFQVTVVFPDGGRKENRSAIFGAMQLVGLVTQTEVEEEKVADRAVLRLNAPQPATVACWQEGEHVVLTIGTEGVDHTVELAIGKRKNLTSNELYHELTEFNSYETIQRGFFDFNRLSRLAEETFPPAAVVIKKLGLTGLNNAAFQIGFQQKLIRSTFILDMPGKREGLLQLLSTTEAVQFGKLPDFPPDAAMVAVSRFDVGSAYNASINAIELAMSMGDPGAVAEFQRGLNEVEKGLGVDLRGDVFACLGSNMIVYNAPSEGPLNMGMVLAVDVKDEEKLSESLDTLISSLAVTTGAHLKQRKYRGALLNTVHVGQQGFPFVPTYTIHKGWLVASFFPQPVQGFVFRSDGKREVWTPPRLAKWAAENATKGNPDARITSISVSDPRPGLQEALSFAPFVTQLASTITGSSDFDISLIPNAQTATVRLTPNVSVAVDDGNEMRIEGYSSLPIPSQLNGLESYMYIVLLSGLRFAL